MGVERSKEVEKIIRHYAALSLSERQYLIVGLVYWFSLYGRDSYFEAGKSKDEAVVRLQSMNEVMQVISVQLLQLIGNGEGYPDDAFFDVLLEAAGDRETFLGAVYRAFRWVSDKGKEAG